MSVHVRLPSAVRPKDRTENHLWIPSLFFIISILIMKFPFLYLFRKMPLMKHTIGCEKVRVASSVSRRSYCAETISDEFEYDMKHVKFPSSTDRFDQSKMKHLLLEIDLLRQMNINLAPETLDPTQWKILTKIEQKSDRLDFYKSLVAAKEARRSSDDFSTSESSNVEECSIGSLFLRVTDAQINRFLNYKLLLAESFGPTLVIDCNYENRVKPHLLNSLINGLLNVWFLNREAKNPFHIIYCNVDKYGELFRRFGEKFYGDADLDYMFNVSEDDYTELFSKTELIYLTPNSKCEIGKFNGRDVLIMGGFVDDISEDFSAVIVCKKEKLRHGKFPIDKFTEYAEKGQSQMLTSEEFIRIINDVKNGIPWSHALRQHIEEDRFKKSRNKSENFRYQRFSKRVSNKIK